VQSVADLQFALMEKRNRRRFAHGTFACTRKWNCRSLSSLRISCQA